MEEKWLTWSKELQALAQAGLTYGKDVFDKERYTRIREISAEILSAYTQLETREIIDIFCKETGYQTPKLDSRAVIVQNDKILLVQEKDGRWALPGGWVDVDQSIRSNTEKEVKEEAGLDVQATRILMLHDRNKHNEPKYAFNICKVFVECKVLGGAFEKNIETISSDYFDLNHLPQLAEEKVNREQILTCIKAVNDPFWQVEFD